MLKTSIQISFALVIFGVISCSNPSKEEKNQSTTFDSTKYELWAEQIESSADMIMPEGWTEQDWKAVTKNVNKEEIFNTIKEAVLNGRLEAFDYITDKIIPNDKIKHLFEPIKDTIYDDNGNQVVTIKTKEIQGAISQIRMREKWMFDKEKMKIEKQVTSIAFFIAGYDEQGFIKGQRALFYVKLDH